MNILEKNLYAEHRRRVKDKFLKRGIPVGTPPHEVLEFLLFYSIPRADTKIIAKRLLQRFGTLSNVFKAPISELMKIDGMGEHSAILIKLIPEIAREYTDDIISKASTLKTSDEIGTYLLGRYAYFGMEEVFTVTSFNNSGKLLCFNIVEKGDIASVGVSTRKVIETLINTNATTAVIAHNHPGGIALPSNEDLKITVLLKNALNAINVNLIDHIIIADGDYVSLAQSEKFKDIFKY